MTGSQATARPGHCLAALLLFLATALSIFFAISLWLQGGAMGFFLGPLKTWSFIFYTAMAVVAATLPEDHFTGFVALLNTRDDGKKTDGDSVESEQPLDGV